MSFGRRWPRIRRVLWGGGILVVLLVVLVVAGLETDGGRAALLRSVLHAVERRTGFEARAESLEVALLRREARVLGFTLSPPGAPPLVRIAEVRLSWPALPVGDGVVPEAVVLEGVRVDLRRGADGRWNLPPATGSGGTGAPAFPERMSLRDAVVTLRDSESGVEAEMGGISLETAGTRSETRGTLDVQEPLRWRAGSQSGEVTFSQAVFHLGRSFTLEAWQARAREGTLNVKGSGSDVFGAGRLAFDLQGDLDLARLSARAGGASDLEGVLRFDGRLVGALDAPEAPVTWRGRATRSAVGPVDIEGRATLTAKHIDIEEATLRVAGGTAGARGRIVMDGAEASRLQADWTGLDVGMLLAARPGAWTPIRGSLSGRLTAVWPQLSWLSSEADVVLEARPGVGAGDSLGIAGQARFGVHSGRWTLDADAGAGDAGRLVGQLRGRVEYDDVMTTSVGGRVDLAFQDLSRWGRAFGRPTVAGRGDATLIVSGTLAAPQAAVELRGAGVSMGDGPSTDVALRAVVRRTGMDVDGLDLHAGSAHAQGEGRVRFADGAVEARYEADLPDLGVLARTLPAGFEPGGALHGRGRVAGTWSAPRITVSAEGANLRLAGQVVPSARFELGFADGQWKADAVDLVQESGRLSVAGSYDLRDHRFTLTAHGRGFSIGDLPAGLAGPESLAIGGTVDVDFEGSGPGSAAKGGGHLTVTGARWQGRGLGPAALELALRPDGLRAKLAADDLALRAEATVNLEAPHDVALTARLEGADLATWAKAAGGDAAVVSGRASLSATVRGSLRNLRAAAVSLAVETLDAQVREKPLRLEQAAVFSVAPGQLRVDGLDLALGSGRFRVDGALDQEGVPSLRGSIEGPLADFAALAGLSTSVETGSGSEAVASIDGTAAATFVISGPLGRPALTGEAGLRDGILRFSRPGIPPVEGVQVQASVGAGTLRLERAEATWSGARLTASGDATGALLEGFLPARWVESNRGGAPQASLHARVEGDLGQVLRPLVHGTVESVGHTAVLTAELVANAPRFEAVRGELRLEGADLRLSNVALDQSGPAFLRIEEGRLKLEGAAWKGPLTELHVEGVARAGPKDDLVGGASLEASVSGQGDLQLLQGFARGIESAGTGTVRLSAKGPLAVLRTEGEIRLNAGSLRHRATRAALDGLSGTLRWSARGIELEGVQGSLNGGPLQASGAVKARESGRGFEGAIRIQARSVFLEWPRGMRARVRVNLALEPSGDGLRLGGTLRILDAAYRTREYFSLQVLDLVERFSRESSPSAFDALGLDLAVKSADDVLLDAVDGRLLVGVDLKLAGSVGAPTLGGRLTAAPGGQVFMSGRTYDIDSAVLDFSRGSGLEPYVQALARTRVSDYSVLADVTGPATRTTTRFASTPPLGQEDIVALLTAGRTVGTGRSGGSQTDALSMASGGMLGKTGQKLGLDSLRIESAGSRQDLDFDPTVVSSETDPSSRLTFSKRLATNLSATFSRSLTKTGGYTWFVAWKPRTSLELRLVQRDDPAETATGAFEFRHDVTIGGGPAAPLPPRRRRRRSGETVSAVQITGDEGAARLSDLRLRQGQPFDYDRWLDDRDRLEEKLARDGFAEARVLASRETPPAEEGAPRRREVELVYEVHRGARTRVVIEGVPSPGALRGRIERAWREGDYASSIEEEAQALARADLYERGFLRARVAARLSIAPSGESKTLTVEVAPGEPVRTRRIAFEGNARVPTPRLEALVRDPARAAAAWLRPQDLQEAVAELYRREGLLAARVHPPRTVFTRDEVLLVVGVDEGRVVPIAEVKVAGADRLGAETVRSAAALAPGQPFKPADVESARARVEGAYRRAGFNEASVRLDGRLDPVAGAMTVEVQVTEGAREVLGEVVVEGGSAGMQARVRRELHLEAGSPVVFDEWTEARRRIYETGLFRRVDLEPAASSPPPSSEPDAQPSHPDRTVNAALKLEEWPALRLRYGLQLVTTGNLASEVGRQDLQLGGVAEVTRRTLFGRAAQTGLSLQARKDEQEGRGFLSLPRTFGTPVRSSLFLTMTRRTSDRGVISGARDRRDTELAWEERIRVTRKLDFAGAYKIQWTRLDFQDPVADLTDGARLDTRLARVVGTALFDTRNDLIDTSRGSFSSLSAEWGGGAIGSDLPLKRVFLQQFAYVPLRGGLVFGAAGRAERASGAGSALLETDQLQAGGANTVRGYTENALVQRGAVNFVGGSTTLFVLNGELRFPVRGPVRGVLFGDGAILRAWLPEKTTWESIWSTGIGVRYVTPVGILRLDYGIPLDLGFKPRRGRVYFSLGQVF